MQNEPEEIKPDISVGLVDDHQLFRKGLISLLGYFPHIHVKFDADGGADLFQKLKSEKEYPDVLLLDIEMPEMDGIEVIHNLSRKLIPMNVMVLTTHNEEALIIELAKLGVKGFLLKTADVHEVVKAIEAIHQGDLYFNEQVSKTILKNIARSTRYTEEYKKSPYYLDLTLREKEIIKLVCSEKSTKEIADCLNVSERTVAWHRSNLIEKTGSRNVAGLALFAVRHGIIE